MDGPNKVKNIVFHKIFISEVKASLFTKSILVRCQYMYTYVFILYRHTEMYIFPEFKKSIIRSINCLMVLMSLKIT